MGKLITNRTAFLALMAAALVLAGVSPAKADTLFTTGGTPLTYINNTGYTAGNVGLAVADSFAPTTTGTLTDIIVPLGLNQGGNGGALTFYIESSSAGVPTGTILDTLTTSSTITTVAGDALYTFTCTAPGASCTNPTLTAGTTYFLVDVATSGGGVNWDINNGTPDVTVYADFSNSTSGLSAIPGEFQPAFQVDGTVATPEPSSLMLLGVGLMGLLIIGRKRIAARCPAQS